MGLEEACTLPRLFSIIIIRIIIIIIIIIIISSISIIVIATCVTDVGSGENGQRFLEPSCRNPLSLQTVAQTMF